MTRVSLITKSCLQVIIYLFIYCLYLSLPESHLFSREIKGMYFRTFHGAYTFAIDPIFYINLYSTPENIHRFDRFAVTTGTVLRKRATLTYWCSVGTWPVLLPLINVHLNLQHFQQNRILCVPMRSDHFSALCVDGLWNLCLQCSKVARVWKVGFGGLSVLMMLVLWCCVKYNIKNVRQECWDGESAQHPSLSKLAPSRCSLQCCGLCWMQRWSNSLLVSWHLLQNLSKLPYIFNLVVPASKPILCSVNTICCFHWLNFHPIKHFL